MKSLTSTLFALSVFLFANFMTAQELNVQSFGDKENPAVIFLHGGPGYNAVPFEIATAEDLAKEGFFVISYDRRGEGRNEHLEADFTFAQTFEDLNAIYSTYNLDKARLVGHSFGGLVATYFTEKYPEKVSHLILASVPISMQSTLKTIIKSSKAIYQENDDTANLSYIAQLEQMDTLSYPYAAYSFMHAMANGFYTPSQRNERAEKLYQRLRADTLAVKYASQYGYSAPMNFWKNESYTSINLKDNLKTLKDKSVEMYGIYGKDDGLYSEAQVEDIRQILGSSRVKYLDNCSHSVFIDRQEEFIALLVGLKK
ncbi:alpha/beta fold hydrolase [Psychroflexus montanilacus]|uniref:alpha/beta fold hydrolase n=1 Tax=Psychroflexus montanilacus TaxID=2873598 RepID=UPI001CCA1192|nr:alpha/beta hydrolase [Psychroflexus montanilacus]MBZ9651596.1 alpha/beta hydrolase [Psychroflexus montanilacus]